MMTRLTEEMVIARSKQSDLGAIKKLNCWGSDLTDVSIIKRMRGVEVLALSVNKISSLQPFEDCVKLEELYLRKNDIKDINEIAYLQNLPHLKYLWLEENPCCEKAGKNYRAIVLHTLPNLKKLDNVDVTQEEVQNAAKLRSGSGGVTGDQQDTSEKVYGQSQQQQPQRQQQPSQPQQSQYQSPQYQQRRSCSPQKEEYYQSDRPAYPSHYRHSQSDLSEWGDHHQQHHHSHHNPYASTVNLTMGHRRSARLERDELLDRYSYRNGRENIDWEDERSKPRRSEARLPDSASVSTVVLNHYSGYHRRPINRNSNLLSATLCLVKELDYQSLEVVEHAVRCRIDELSAD